MPGYINSLLSRLLRPTPKKPVDAPHKWTVQPSTDETRRELLQLLDYVATHPNAVIRYHKSGMVLHVDSKQHI